MKKYEWYSELPPEMVRARLSVRGKPMQRAWDSYDEHCLFVKFQPNGRFCVLKTGGMMQLRPQFPFAGTVTPWGTRSMIAGQFALPRAGLVQFAVLGGIALIAALLFGVPPLVALLFVAAFGGLGYGLAQAAGADPSHPQNRETLEFIEENLLRE